jgi:hypothetical protein
MRTRFVLVSVAVLLGCASAPNANRAASLWPGGSEPQLRAVSGVAFGQPGSLRFVSSAPLYVVFLELRPSLDSLDVRASNNRESEDALIGATDLFTSMQTVDALQRSTVSAQFNNCTTVKMGAGDDVGKEVCPVSRSYGPEGPPKWRFRNRVFLLVSDRPFAAPLPRAIRWAARYTTPPVAPGSRWTAFEL